MQSAQADLLLSTEGGQTVMTTADAPPCVRINGLLGIGVLFGSAEGQMHHSSAAPHG